MPDHLTLAAVTAAFLVAGFVKGIVGLGLPIVSLALLTVLIGHTEAMALMLVPALVVNVWQAATGGQGRAILRRIWPFLAAATLTVWLGAAALTRVDPDRLSALLGGLLVAYALIGLLGVRLSLTPVWERRLGPPLGAINGIFAGMTGSFSVPGVLFLQAIGLSRDVLIQAMGLLFTLSTLALAAAMQGERLLTGSHWGLSGAAVLPALLGVALGQRVRRRLSQARFHGVFLTALLLLGLAIVARS